MPTYSSAHLNKLCRREYLPYVFGRANEDVPPLNGSFSFTVLRMVPVVEDVKGAAVQSVSRSIRYMLEPTARIVTATNSTRVRVRQGNKVILTQSRHGYDIFMDCSENETAMVMEPCLPMLMPLVKPNFAGTDVAGTYYSNEDVQRSLSSNNAMCVGTIAIEGKRYFPLHATYMGGERYYDVEGNVQYRLPGEEQRNNRGDPLYILRRELVKTEAHFLSRREYANQRGASSGNVPPIQRYVDNSYEYQYVDGSPCPFRWSPNIPSDISGITWATTTDVESAQYGYDLCLCPKQAVGEPIPPHILVSVLREQTTTYKYPMRNKFGESIDPVLSGVVNEKTTSYFEILPPTDRYFTKLRGQAQTYGFMVTTAFDPSHDDYPFTFEDTEHGDLMIIDCKGVSKSRRYVYANALLDDDGAVKLYEGWTHKVVNLTPTSPSRGVFRIQTHDMFFDVLFSLATERGFGIPCATWENIFENGVNVDRFTPLYYDIVRRLVDPMIGRYELQVQLHQGFRFMHNSIIESALAFSGFDDIYFTINHD